MPIDYRGALTLVTGASSGLGAEFARQFARRGSDLVLVARREDRLKALAAEVEAHHAVTATVLQADLSQPGAATRLAGELRDRSLRLTGLVNNAGFGTFGQFSQLEPERIHSEIAVDVQALTDMTRTFIAELEASGRGVLINVASLAAYNPVPGMAVYAAAKAFVLSLTEALWYEHRHSSLRVLALSPGAAKTEFFDVAGPSAAGEGRLQTPGEVVATALGALDRRNPPPSIAVGRMNRIILPVGRLASRKRSVMMMGTMAGRTPAPQ